MEFKHVKQQHVRMPKNHRRRWLHKRPLLLESDQPRQLQELLAHSNLLRSGDHGDIWRTKTMAYHGGPWHIAKNIAQHDQNVRGKRMSGNQAMKINEAEACRNRRKEITTKEQDEQPSNHQKWEHNRVDMSSKFWNVSGQATHGGKVRWC